MAGRRWKAVAAILSAVTVVVPARNAPAGTPAAPTGAPVMTAPADAPLGSASAFLMGPDHQSRGQSLTAALADAWTLELGDWVTQPLIVGGSVFVSTTSVGGPDRLWAVDPATGGTKWGPVALPAGARIAADGANVYVVGAGELRALHQANGEPAWSRAEIAVTDPLPPVVHDGTLYVSESSSGGGIRAYRAADGEPLWTSLPIDATWRSPTVTDDGVFVSGECGGVSRLDPHTGIRTWTRSMPPCGLGGGSTPMVHEGRVYVLEPSPSPPHIAVLDAATGAGLSELPGAMWSMGVADGVGYVTEPNQLSAIDLSAGLPLWSVPTDGHGTAPLVLGGLVALGSVYGTVDLFDASTGEIVWSRDLGVRIEPTEDRRFGVALAAAEGILLVPAGPKLFAYRDERAPTITTVSAPAGPTTWADATDLTAEVDPADATGSVAFHANGSLAPIEGCGSVAVGPDGLATCSTTDLPVGANLIEVAYYGDAAHGTSVGSTTHQVGAGPGGGSISGVVSDRGSDIVHAFAVDERTSEVLAQTPVRPDGSYVLEDLPAADVFVFFGAGHPYWGPSSRSDEAWPDAHLVSDAAAVRVAGETIGGIDADLEETGATSGTVTWAGGEGPIGGALVEVRALGNTTTQEASRFVLTSATGTFTVDGLDFGIYEVEVDHDSNGFVDAVRRPVTVSSGAEVSLGTITIGQPTEPAPPPTNLTATPGVGRVTLAYDLPANYGDAFPEFVYVTAWPWWYDIAFSDGGLRATVQGVLNGVQNRFVVHWSGGQYVSAPAVVDSVPTGCAYLWFLDVAASSSFCEEIRWLVYEGISEGYSDATYRPAAGVSRQAMAAFLHRFAGSPDGIDPTCADAQFADVPASHPFCGEIAWLVESGITTGYPDGMFRGHLPVSRQAMAAFLYRFAGRPNGPTPTCAAPAFPDVPVESAFCGEIEWLVGAGIASGYSDGRFRPGAAVSRQAMAAFLERLDGSSATGQARRRQPTDARPTSLRRMGPPPAWTSAPAGDDPLIVRSGPEVVSGSALSRAASGG